MAKSTEIPNYKEIDAYIERLFTKQDRALTQALADSEREGLPQISVSPNEGHLLSLLARLSGAKRILEIGLLGGYSTIWLARGMLPGGKLISLELEKHHAEVAAKNLERAGLKDCTEIRVGPALESMKKMVAANEAPFDLIFIDADKTGYPDYLEWSLKLVRPGSVILADNLLRNGKVLHDAPGERDVQALRKFNKMVSKNPGLDTILLPIVRENMDGVAIIRVR